ncbi:hypothetical protein BJP34_33575 [Moorena producens PAL-8-15-08-1]|uniref:Uncharacterized protein n=1 Tax=Moorena producens PAL-8-15-08-1 TaxID=1458985 RepID=A0A1D8U1C4_9CYAN|nr:hypothetical protein [Moorena producens]AOX03707.1 hypothetical protein BJP34_33575 [Moorena producens PAL-8-15-08-1]
MTENLTISNAPPAHPGMNFALLRQEGIKHIERLGGKLWTDYNTHDPGITILEQLCYAITDLSYRLDFEMKDLLVPSAGENRKQFFTAREILTVNPLTINDYRKLLIDIDGVKNAWIKPIKNSQPPIYYDSLRHTLTFEASKRTQQVNLNGLYRVLIEKDKNVSDEASLIEKVKSKLNQHRNLCEDFASVEILPIEEITIFAEIEIEEGFDVNELMAQIYLGLDNFISPHLHFFTLKELLDQGKTPEAIFDGVPLEHGFIDDEKLDSFIKKDQLRTSDLISIISDIPGIKNVGSITISRDNSSESEELALALDPNLTPQLKYIDCLTSNITFCKGQISCNPNLNKAKNYLESLRQKNPKTPSTTQIKDIPIPVGQYRELSDYESIQNDFPATYGIGEIGLPASASPKRKAQAKQLQAYLMFFDQLLANYLAQLEHTKDLLDFQTKNKTTYFYQELYSIPGAPEILNFEQNSPDGKWNDIDKIRRNRFLDHLMAQFCEKFTDYSLLLYDLILEEKLIDDKLIDDKINLLQKYPQISAGRGKAFNYTDSSQVWDTDNVSGLKQRICSLLGIPYHRKTLALCNESDETEGFHIVEHILLRPRSSNDSKQNPNFLGASQFGTLAILKGTETFALSLLLVIILQKWYALNFLDFGHPISEFKRTDSNTIVTCVSDKHGLSNNERIQIFNTRNYNGIYSVRVWSKVDILACTLLIHTGLYQLVSLLLQVQQDTFDIEIETEVVESETGKWVQLYHPIDPYSFQISFVFPDWLPRFREENFKKLIYNIISAEIPAHITPYFHWLNKTKMLNFETAYTHWLNTIVDKKTTPVPIKSTTNNLIEALEIGRVGITSFSVLGYMTIGTDFEVIC